MRLFTVQDFAAWDEAQRSGVLTQADEAWIDPCFRTAYRWMQHQMSERLKSFSGHLPIWAWTRRPDLRRRWGNRGASMVLLTVDVPSERVLLSDYEGWHYVLNDWYLGLTDEEFEEQEQREPTQEEIEATWPRIFGPFPLWERYPDTELQACVDRVLLDEVIEIRPFKSR